MKVPFLSKNKKKVNSRISKKTPKQKVIIYSTKTCPWCKKTKEFFKKNNIKYTEKDVSKSRKNADEMIKKSGQSGVPVVNINGEIIIGFNEGKLKKSLGL